MINPLSESPPVNSRFTDSDDYKWIVDEKETELSVTYGKIDSYGWADVDKIILPEANPRTIGQRNYFLEVAQVLCDSLNAKGIKPYYDQEPEDVTK